MFEFRYEINDEDYLSFNLYHFFNSNFEKKALFSFRCVIPVICLTYILIFCVLKAPILLILLEAVALAVFSIIWVVFSEKIMLRTLGKKMKELKKNGKPPYSENGTLRFDDEYMYSVSTDSEAKYKYCTIEKVGVTEKAVYIYYSTLEALILPTPIFSDKDERKKFLEFINSKAGSSPRI